MKADCSQRGVGQRSTERGWKLVIVISEADDSVGDEASGGSGPTRTALGSRTGPTVDCGRGKIPVYDATNGPEADRCHRYRQYRQQKRGRSRGRITDEETYYGADY